MTQSIIHIANWAFQPTFFHSTLRTVEGLFYGLDADYPTFVDWYKKKVISGFVSGERSLVVTYVGSDVAGFALLKNTYNEKKICTLRIVEKYQRNRIGAGLLLECMRVLDTSRPYITVSSRWIDSFAPLLFGFGFSLTKEVVGAYRSKNTEFFFNGPSYRLQ